MDEAVSNFVAFTGATPEIARRYLAFTENNPEQAIQLFFDSPDLASASEAPQSPPVPIATQLQTAASRIGREDASGVVHIDSDDEDMEDDNEVDDDLVQAAALSRAADVEDDEAMARRMQEELYAGGDASNDLDQDGVRAPIARKTETLIGGPDDGEWGQSDYMHAAVAQQMRNRAQASTSSKTLLYMSLELETNGR